jgi:hypothetical protein
MSLISFYSFLTMHYRYSIFPLPLLGVCSSGFTDGLVKRSPLLGWGWIYFLTREAWPYLNPFIWNYIILSSSKLSARVFLGALLTNMEIEAGSALA